MSFAPRSPRQRRGTSRSDYPRLPPDRRGGTEGLLMQPVPSCCWRLWFSRVLRDNGNLDPQPQPTCLSSRPFTPTTILYHIRRPLSRTFVALARGGEAPGRRSTMPPPVRGRGQATVRGRRGWATSAPSRSPQSPRAPAAGPPPAAGSPLPASPRSSAHPAPCRGGTAPGPCSNDRRR